MTEIIKTARVDGRVDGWTGIGTLRGPRGPKKMRFRKGGFKMKMAVDSAHLTVCFSNSIQTCAMYLIYYLI